MTILMKFPEHFIYNDNHYYDLDQFISYCDLSKEEIEKLEDDWFEILEETKLEPLMQFDLDTLSDLIIGHVEDRTSEHGDEIGILKKVLKENINFKLIQEKMPDLYYPTGKEYTLTKQDLLDYIA